MSEIVFKYPTIRHSYSKEVISMLGDEVLNKERSPFINQLLSLNIPIENIADCLLYRSESGTIQFEDFPRDFQHGVLELLQGRRGISRFGLSILWAAYYQKNKHENPGLTEVARVIANTKPLALLKISRVSNIFSRKAVKIANDAGNDLKKLPLHYVQPTDEDFEGLRQEDSERVVNFFSPAISAQDASFTSGRYTGAWLERGTQLFSLRIGPGDMTKALLALDPLKAKQPNTALYLVSAQYRTPENGVCFANSIQSWVRLKMGSHPLVPKIRDEIQDLERPMLQAFKGYLKGQGCHELVLPTGDSILRTSHAPIARSTAERLNRIYSDDFKAKLGKQNAKWVWIHQL